jgi:alkaline phosphatase D
MDMWESFHEILAERQADFVIGCGDQVYTDGNKKISIWEFLRRNKERLPKTKADRLDVMKSWYRDIYRGYWGPPPVQHVHRNFPNYMIWDDHEIMDGWGSYKKSELSDKLDTIWEWENKGKNLALAYEMFETAKTVYAEYQDSHNPQRPREPNHPKRQWDYTFDWGIARFFVLDMRGRRDFDRKSNDRILSSDQMNRLLKWIKNTDPSKTEVLFIVSPVPVVHVSQFIVNHLDFAFFGVADDLRDEWEHDSNWIERDKLLDAVFEFSDAHGVPTVFLSGDVHIGAAFKLSRESCPKAKVFQLTSSAITYYLNWFERSTLKLIVRDHGTLGAKPPSRKASKKTHSDYKKRLTQFRLIHILNRNNFGLIGVEPDVEGNGFELSWDLYGDTDKENEIAKLKRVALI